MGKDKEMSFQMEGGKLMCCSDHTERVFPQLVSEIEECGASGWLKASIWECRYL